MTKPGLGISTGAVLGLADGLSAWAYPEARDMIMAIVVSSTIKGVLTGAAAGWLARKWRSVPGGIAAGTAIGFLLSTLAAIPVVADNSSRYYDIVLPGMLLGAIVGFVTQRYPSAHAGAAGRQFLGVAVALIGSMAAVAASQQANSRDRFERIAFLIGRWQGTTDGKPGKGSIQREYTRALNSRFIRATNRSEYPAQEKNPKGEVHEDEGWFSFDRSRKRLVFRQFHVEGFVNHYVEDAESSTSKVVFTSESIENIPAGWRAREIYIIHGADEFEEVFELAEPGKQFAVYSRARLKRVK
jgi:hypothetical protein